MPAHRVHEVAGRASKHRGTSSGPVVACAVPP